MAKSKKNAIHAVAYLRTSSATNIGADKDSEKRQREAIETFASRAGFEIVATFYDEAVSGADPIDTRPGFEAMLERLTQNGARTIIVETANRFARDLIVQETGYSYLKERGIELIAADAPESFVDDTPTAIMIRQILGSVSQFDKAMTVAKLKGARDRKRATGVKVEGRKAHHEIRPDAVIMAKDLRRKRGGRRMPYRTIADELAKAGHLNENGKPFAAKSIRDMIDGPRPKGDAR